MARASSFRHFSPRLTKLDKVSLLEVIMKKFFVRAVVAFALVFAVSVPVLADTIRLKDGSVIRGQIVSFKNEQFTILVGSGARGRKSRITARTISRAISRRSQTPRPSRQAIIRNSLPLTSRCAQITRATDGPTADWLCGADSACESALRAV